jgi:hypothetical protein
MLFNNAVSYFFKDDIVNLSLMLFFDFTVLSVSRQEPG